MSQQPGPLTSKAFVHDLCERIFVVVGDPPDEHVHFQQAQLRNAKLIEERRAMLAGMTERDRDKFLRREATSEVRKAQRWNKQRERRQSRRELKQRIKSLEATVRMLVERISHGTGSPAR